MHNYVTIYRSVAATVVEMATGKPPYVGENFISHNIMAIIFQVGSYKINPLTSMKKSGWDVADNLERFLSSCFERYYYNNGTVIF